MYRITRRRLCRCGLRNDGELDAVDLWKFCTGKPVRRFAAGRIAFVAHKLDELAVRHFKLDLPPADMGAWRSFVDRIITPKHRVKIGIVGKYMENQDAYKSIYESLTHAGAANSAAVS